MICQVKPSTSLFDLNEQAKQNNNKNNINKTKIKIRKKKKRKKRKRKKEKKKKKRKKKKRKKKEKENDHVELNPNLKEHNKGGNIGIIGITRQNNIGYRKALSNIQQFQ